MDRMYNCKMSPEQNERMGKIQDVAERALHKMSYEDIANELGITVEDVNSRLEELKGFNPQAYDTIMRVRDTK